ncbi:hypothetical protein QR680_002767 [Steinernema hermaphroditum]|uniref:Uncharacterized protein n=1 Tax=Steinernema hermaphroditum TaxID=289476 RepID=A0AA39H4V8_9BILA|nr:hypothetical protein QR680_002767 [Steinernema hermaphroditum]
MPALVHHLQPRSQPTLVCTYRDDYHALHPLEIQSSDLLSQPPTATGPPDHGATLSRHRCPREEAKNDELEALRRATEPTEHELQELKTTQANLKAERSQLQQDIAGFKHRIHDMERKLNEVQYIKRQYLKGRLHGLPPRLHHLASVPDGIRRPEGQPEVPEAPPKKN